jgi:hypothetical protein
MTSGTSGQRPPREPPGASSRRAPLVWILAVALLSAALAVALGSLKWPGEADSDRLVDIYRTHGCLCAIVWSRALDREGFTVRMHEYETLRYVRGQLHTPPQLRGCHVAKYLGYFVEGHVAPSVLRRLAEELPEAVGVGVAGRRPAAGAVEPHEHEFTTGGVLLFRSNGEANKWSEAPDIQTPASEGSEPAGATDEMDRSAS